jgi:hypothetical protein
VNDCFTVFSWIGLHEEKLGMAVESDKPAYSDTIRRQIRYNVVGFTLPVCGNGALLAGFPRPPSNDLYAGGEDFRHSSRRPLYAGNSRSWSDAAIR